MAKSLEHIAAAPFAGPRAVLADSTPPVSLVVIGIGVQWASQTTLSAQRAIELADAVLFAVADPWAARWIRRLNPAAASLTYPRDGRPRRAIYDAMVEQVLVAVRSGKRVCAVFYGSPTLLADPAHESLRRARAEGFGARMLPGVSALECLFADLDVDPGSVGCQVYEASDFLLRARTVDAHAQLVLFQIALIGQRGPFEASNERRIRRGLALLRERLRAWYPAHHEVIVYEAATQPRERPHVDRMPLHKLADAHVSEVSTLYVPAAGCAPIDPTMARLLGELSQASQDAWRSPQHARMER